MIAREGGLLLEHSEGDVRSPMSRLPYGCLVRSEVPIYIVYISLYAACN